jgi:hypothetical protein
MRRFCASLPGRKPGLGGRAQISAYALDLTHCFARRAAAKFCSKKKIRVG